MDELTRLRAIRAMDNLEAAVEQTLGPQCPTVADGVRCVESLGHRGPCDTRPWWRPARPEETLDG